MMSFVTVRDPTGRFLLSDRGFYLVFQSVEEICASRILQDGCILWLPPIAIFRSFAMIAGIVGTL